MNEEIKEILDKINCTLKKYERDKKLNQVSPESICFLSPKEQQILLDYITNLQEELTILVKDDERSQETIIRLNKENDNLRKDLLNYLEEWENVDDLYYQGRCKMARDVLRKLEGDEDND